MFINIEKRNTRSVIKILLIWLIAFKYFILLKKNLLVAVHSMWDPSFQTRGSNPCLCIGSLEFNHWTTVEVPQIFQYMAYILVFTPPHVPTIVIGNNSFIYRFSDMRSPKLSEASLSCIPFGIFFLGGIRTSEFTNPKFTRMGSKNSHRKWFDPIAKVTFPPLGSHILAIGQGTICSDHWLKICSAQNSLLNLLYVHFPTDTKAEHYKAIPSLHQWAVS